MAPHGKIPGIHSLEDVRREMGDEVTDEALGVLRIIAPNMTDQQDAIGHAKSLRDASGGDPKGVLGVAVALLVRGFVDIHHVPDDPVYDGEVVSVAAPAPVERVPDEVVFPRSLGPLWKLQACLRLSKTDTNGLEILQTGVTEFLLNNGISEPGLQAQFDAQQEMMKE